MVADGPHVFTAPVGNEDTTYFVHVGIYAPQVAGGPRLLDEYVGEFKENNICGKGVYSWADGRKYDGEWQDNQMHGFGEFRWPDGRKYIGNFVQDKRQGKGFLKWYAK